LAKVRLTPSPKNVALFSDDVANIDADTKFNPAVFRNVSCAVGYLALGFQGALHRVNSACKLNQRPIAGFLDDATPGVR
jgi:hypothetical protein